jgi:ABC-type nitrate/sulfonate/bicarbonate transport system permease component
MSTVEATHAALPARSTRFGTVARAANVLGLVTLVALVGLWELLVDAHAVQSSSLSSPSAITRASWPLITSGTLPGDLWHTLGVTLLGWAIASTGGLLLGLLLGFSRTAWSFSMASLEVLRGIPGIAFVTLAIVLFGLSTKMELAIVIYVSVWPVLVNTITGVRNVTSTHSDLAALLRLNWHRRATKIVLPSAMPHVVVALRLALASALALAVVAEMLGNPHGAGYHLIIEQQSLHPARMFAYVVSVGLLGVLLNSGFMLVLLRVAPGISVYLREGDE